MPEGRILSEDTTYTLRLLLLAGKILAFWWFAVFGRYSF